MTSLRLGADPIVGGFPALSTLTNAILRVFLGLVSAGFTEDQSLRINTGIIGSD